MASTADLFTDAENGGPPSPTTVSATRTPGSTTLACNALVQWPTNTKVHFVTGPPITDAEGNPIINPATLCLWSGVVSGTTIVNLVLRGAPAFPTDPGNNINDIVQMAPTSSWEHDMFLGATKDHDTQGHHMALHDVNNKLWIDQTATANAVNNLLVSNASTGNPILLSAEGTDTNIPLKLSGKGTGGVLTPLSLFGVGNSLNASPPTTNGIFYLQAGYQIVTTNSSGIATLTFPVAFPNGLLTVLFSSTNASTPIQVTLNTGGTNNASQCSVYCEYTNNPNSFVNTGNVQFEWIAIGF